MSTMYLDNPLGACTQACTEQCNRMQQDCGTYPTPQEVGEIMLKICSPAEVPRDMAWPAEAGEGFCQQRSAFLGQRATNV